MSTDQSAPTTIDAYLAAFPPEVQALLQQMRQVIHEAVPNLGETISYGMPTLFIWSPSFWGAVYACSSMECQ